MLTPEPEMIGRFEEHRLPDGSVLYKEVRGDNHYYHGEIKSSSSAKGGYSFVKGSTLTGVSTASKFLDGDPTGLMHWAANRDQDGVARIASADLDAGRSLDWLRSQESIAARLHEAEATWVHERDRRADQGTNVHHETVWKLATGAGANLGDLTETEREFGRAVFRSFRQLQPDVLYAEQVTAALDKRIAGTFDLLANVSVSDLDCPEVRGEIPESIRDLGTCRLLVDYKTRDAAGKIRQSDLLQVRGYDDCNRSCGIGESDAQAVIIVLPTGSWELFWGKATAGQWAAAVNSCLLSKPLAREVAAMSRAAKNAVEAVIA